MTNIKQRKKRVNPELYIYERKYQDASDKALDWLIKSWKLTGTDKEIALLLRKKYNEIAMDHLKKLIDITDNHFYIEVYE